MRKTVIATAIALIAAIALVPSSALACPTCGGGQQPYPNPGPFPPGVPHYPNPGPLPPGTGSPMPQPQRPPIQVQIQVMRLVPVPVYDWVWDWNAYRWRRIQVDTRYVYRTDTRWVYAQWYASCRCYGYVDSNGNWQRVQPGQPTRSTPQF